MSRPTDTTTRAEDGPNRTTNGGYPSGESLSLPRWALRYCALCVLIVLAFAARRVAVDFPALGFRAPTSAEDASYASHRLLAYAHIGPGAIYLIGGAAQLSARIRTRHYTLHRRLGRVVLVSGGRTGILAIVYGLKHPFGGPVEGAAALCFGIWFEACLITAFRRIRRGDTPSPSTVDDSGLCHRLGGRNDPAPRRCSNGASRLRGRPCDRVLARARSPHLGCRAVPPSRRRSFRLATLTRTLPPNTPPD